MTSKVLQPKTVKKRYKGWCHTFISVHSRLGTYLIRKFKRCVPNHLNKQIFLFQSVVRIRWRWRQEKAQRNIFAASEMKFQQIIALKICYGTIISFDDIFRTLKFRSKFDPYIVNELLTYFIV